jgi:ribosomal protein S18 acetylase RimI-like enzyme
MPNELHTPDLHMEWSMVSWDQEVCGFPVMQIRRIQVSGQCADRDINTFEIERDALGVGLVSCRLPHDRIRESILLEDHDFRFIEMLYLPEFNLLNFKNDDVVSPLVVRRAGEADLPQLLAIARTVFQNERFKMDPRLDPNISEKRFQNWVSNSLHHATQELFIISEGIRLLSFFVTELLDDGTCYWHLNAVSPDAQGQGYGRRVWLSMLNHAVSVGAKRVRSSIAVRNHRVLNLYARLGFVFKSPLMTFHWVRSHSK